MNYPKYDYVFRISIVGGIRVGKSCLIYRFCRDIYNDEYLMTLGMDYNTKDIMIEGNKILLGFWDMDGGKYDHIDYYDHVLKPCLKSSQAIILAYDISISSIEMIDYLYKEIKQDAALDSCFVLVGCKSDHFRRNISEEEGKKYAEKLDINFFETSSKTNYNVHELFYFIARQVYTTQKEKNNLDKFKFKQKIETKKFSILDYFNFNSWFKSENENNDNFQSVINKLKKENENLIKENNRLKKNLADKKNIINNLKIIKEELEKMILNMSFKISSLDEELKQYGKKLKEQGNKTLFDNQLKNQELKIVTFISFDENIIYSLNCKNTDIFQEIIFRLYDEYPQYKNYRNIFTRNGVRIDENKTLEENKISNNSIINIESKLLREFKTDDILKF